MLIHAVVLIRQRHPRLFEDSDLVSDDCIAKKLLSCVNDDSISMEMRSYAVNLLREFGLWCDGDVLFKQWRNLWPSVFDESAIVSAKLQTLVFCFDDTMHKPPQNFLQCLSVLDEFRNLSSASFLASIVFAVLKLILTRLDAQFDAVYRLLLDLLVYSPQFLPNLIDSLGFFFFFLYFIFLFFFFF
jgi:hypothetical protein